MSHLADTSELKAPKKIEEVVHKCFLNDEEVPCRNMSFNVPTYCKPKNSVDDIRPSSMSCMLGTPIRLDTVIERLQK